MMSKVFLMNLLRKKVLFGIFVLSSLFATTFFVAQSSAHYCTWSSCPCPIGCSGCIPAIGGACCSHSGGCAVGFGTACDSCLQSQCDEVENTIIPDDHENGETRIMENMRNDFHEHREWIVQTYLPMIIPAYMLMAEQMSNVGMYQMYLVGKFFDSKLHLESQLLFNELQNEAAKDYYPSDSFCWFGTNTRSLSNSEALARANQGTMNRISTHRQLGELNSASSYTNTSQDKRSRWEQFVAEYCDPHDNDFTGATSGLVDACGAGAADDYRANIDIDYQRLIEEPRFLEIDFTAAGLSEDEEDVIALSRNLYGHDPIVVGLGSTLKDTIQARYYNLRSLAAKRNVAVNSYNAIVGMKSRGSGGGGSPQYLKAVIADLGMANADVEEILGDNPSYYAQLEALGKKIYQNTDFFTDLYDKPANVKRKQAAMNAIELMLDRAMYESELRQEIILSVLLSSYLEDDKEQAYLELQNAGKN